MFLNVIDRYKKMIFECRLNRTTKKKLSTESCWCVIYHINLYIGDSGVNQTLQTI